MPAPKIPRPEVRSSHKHFRNEGNQSTKYESRDNTENQEKEKSAEKPLVKKKKIPKKMEQIMNYAPPIMSAET